MTPVNLLSALAGCVCNKISRSFTGCSASTRCLLLFALLVTLYDKGYREKINVRLLHLPSIVCLPEMGRRWLGGVPDGLVWCWAACPSSPDLCKGCSGQDLRYPGQHPGKGGWCPHGCLECAGLQLPALFRGKLCFSKGSSCTAEPELSLSK